MSLFKLGQVVATPSALAACEQHQINPLLLLSRHCTGDWGDLDAHDVKANVDAIAFDGRILSSYKLQGEKFYVITEWDRSVTTLLLASDY